jgi:hypothetical protein
MLHFQGLISVPHHQFPPTAERPIYTFQPSMPARQQGDDIIQNGPCPRCSKVQRTQVWPATEYPVEQQDAGPFGVSSLYDDSIITPLITSLFKNANTPHLNQGHNVNNRGETVTSVPIRIWASQSVVRAKKISHVLIADALT